MFGPFSFGAGRFVDIHVVRLSGDLAPYFLSILPLGILVSGLRDW